MTLSGLVDLACADPGLARALERARTDTEVVAPASLWPILAAALSRRIRADGGGAVLAVTATGREAEDLTAALSSLLGPGRVAHFPAWETLPHEKLSPRSDTVGQRLAVLRRLVHPDASDVRAGAPGDGSARWRGRAPVRAVLQPMVSGLADLEPVRLESGEDADMDEVVRKLVDAGYHRVDLVEKRGEIAVRGGILDVFPPTEEHPLRVEFWGDTVEEIRYFKAADQRSLEVARHGLWAPPCRELPLTAQVRERAAALAEEHPALADILGRIAGGDTVEGMEALSPVLADRMELLTDLLPDGSVLLVCEPERIRTRSAELVRTSQEFLEASWVNAAAGGEAPIDLGAAAFRSLEEVREHSAELGLPRWSVTALNPGTRGEENAEPGDPLDAGGGAVDLGVQPAEAYRGDTMRVFGDLKAWIDGGWHVVMVTAGHGPAERLVQLARRGGPRRAARRPVRPARPSARARGDRAARARIRLGVGQARGAHRDRPVRAAVVHEGHAAAAVAAPRRHRPAAAQAGDYVVHEQHGVGRYVEMVSRTVHGATREYLILEYAKGDRLFVPTDQLEELTRYVGGEAPSLHRLGGADWQKAKCRARKAVRQIAGELIRLYSARMASPGHAFAPRHPLAAGARGRLPLRGDARPARRHRRGQGRHGEARPDGPADLRRRRLRQDRDRGAGGVQGGAGRQAGRGAGADDAAGAAALRRSPSGSRRSRSR